VEQKELIQTLDNIKSEIEKASDLKIQAVKDNAAKEAKAFTETIEELRAKYAEVQKQADELTARQKDIKIGQQKGETVREKIQNALEANLKGFDPNNMKSSATFDVKAAGTMLISGNYSGGTWGLTDHEPGLTRLVRRMPFLRQIINVGRISKPYASWAEQRNRDGGAGQTAEGAAKTQADFDVVEAQKKVEKITSFIKTSKENLDDIAYMTDEINNELLELVELKLDADLLSGSGTTPALKGILEYATTFSVAGSVLALGIDQANDFDVIRAAVWQVANGGLGKFQPNYVLLNPATAAKMDMTKLTDGQYVIPPFTTANGQRIAGLTVIENTGVTAGDFLVGDFNKSNLRIKEDLNIQVGFDGSDFTNNLVTILAELRAVHYIKGNHTGAFIKGTFSTARAAMETA
jgi:HK97 family phage major capsid protein